MLLQRGPVILSPGNSLPQSVENVEPKISQIVDNLIEISCKEDVLNGNHRSTSSSSSSTSADTEDEPITQDEQNLLINNGEDEQNLRLNNGEHEQTLCTDNGENEQNLHINNGESQQNLCIDNGVDEQHLHLNNREEEQSLHFNNGDDEQNLYTNNGEDEQNLRIKDGEDEQNLRIHNLRQDKQVHEKAKNEPSDNFEDKPWQTSSVEMEDAPPALEDTLALEDAPPALEDASPALEQTNLQQNMETTGETMLENLKGETGVISQEMSIRVHDEVIIETTISTEIRQETFLSVEGRLAPEPGRGNIQTDEVNEIAKQTRTHHSKDVVEHETNNETHPSSGVKDEPQTEIEPKVEKVDKEHAENKDTLSDVTVHIDNPVATGHTKHVKDRATDLVEKKTGDNERSAELAEKETGDNNSSMDSYETQLEKSLELTCPSVDTPAHQSTGESADTAARQSIGEGAETPVRASIHRVTFNTRNEVASEDKDGSLLVTYLPLEQRIKERSPLPGREPIKVKYVERTNPLSSAARIIDFNDSTFVEHAGDNLNASRESEEEGWENPFQPEGEVSHDADLILRLWKGGNLQQNLEAAITQLQEAEEEEAKENYLIVQEEARVQEEEEKKKEAELLNPSPPNNKPQPSLSSNAETRLVHKQKHKNLLKKACSLM